MTIKQSQSPRGRSPSIEPRHVKQVYECFPKAVFLRLGRPGSWKAPAEDEKRGYQRREVTPARRANVVAHVQEGGYVGLWPGSIGALVVDIDSGGRRALHWVADQLGDRLADHLTSEPGDPFHSEPRSDDGFHCWYRGPNERFRGAKWHGEGDAIEPYSGEIRHHDGYVVVWCGESLVAVARALKRGEGKAPDLSRITPASRDVAQDGESNDTRATGPDDHRMPDVRLALDHLVEVQAASDHDDWIKNVGMPLHHFSSGDKWGEELFDEYSERLPKYDGSGEVHKRWISFGKSSGRPRAIGSLFKYAAREGWNNPHFEVDPETEFGIVVDDDPINGDGSNGSHTTEADRVERILAAMGVRVRINADKDQMQFSRDGRTWNPLERDSEIPYLLDKMERHIANGETFRKVVGSIDRLNRNLDALCRKESKSPFV